MPLADLKKGHTLVRFKWSYDKDIVTVNGFFGMPSDPNDPVKLDKMKKTKAQEYWRMLVSRGFKHIGTFEQGQQIK